MAQKLIIVRSTNAYSIRAFAATQLVNLKENITKVFVQLSSSATELCVDVNVLF